jgi:hypothetical protein
MIDMEKYKMYRRTQTAEMRPYQPGEVLPVAVSVTKFDRDNGSPKAGDMLARNPKNFEDQWLVAAQYFMDNFEALDDTNCLPTTATEAVLYQPQEIPE